jgi:hypothetical protein
MPEVSERISRLTKGKGVSIMKLMTKTLERRFALVGSQEGTKDPLVIARFFNPTGAGTWYATEFNPDTRIFFGYVSIFGDWNDEWGSFSLDELENFHGRFGLGIERDLHFQEERASQVINKHL